MREVNSDISNAITISQSIKVRPRLTAYKSRIYFEQADLDNEVYSPTLNPIVGFDDVTYPVDPSHDVRIYFDEGGVRFDYDAISSPGRIFDPIKVLTIGSDAALLLNAGAAMLGDKCFMYFTRYDGAVQGIYYDTVAETWSDYFIAIPEDLSSFDITSVFSYNDRIFMTGRFYRKEQFSSTAVYTLFCYSDDGLTFSLDRKVLVSIVDLRFSSRYDEGTGDLVFYTEDKLYRESAPYQVIGEDASNVNIIMTSVSGSPMGGWNATLKSGNEQYYTDPLVVEGGYAKLEIGIFTISNDFEWVKYHDCVITAIDRAWADGERAMTISLTADGMWHTSVMSHPYYMEWQGKQFYQSAMQDLSGFQPMGGGSGQRWPLTQDFWLTGVADGYTRQTHAGSTSTDNWANDLMQSNLVIEYPTFEDPALISDYAINIYGWSRAGVPSENPNVPDTTPTDTLNDSFYGLVLVEDLNKAEHTLVAVIGDKTSTYANPPQTYFPAGVRAGSYPVSFTIPNPGEGWKIKKLGIRVISDTGSTTYFLERVEMPEVITQYTTVVSSGYKVEDDPDAIGYKRVISTQKGIDQILFSTPAPYSTWNFDLTGRFEINGPYSYAGLLGLATDKDNFVMGYARPGYIGFAKMRTGLRTTIHEDVASGIADGDTVDVRFWHRDGKFGVEWKDLAAVTWPQRGSMLTWEWTEADGELTIEYPLITPAQVGLKTDATGAYVYHTGIWSLIDPPKFRTCGFRSSGNMIPVMPLDLDPETSASAFSAFPSSGNISCDDYIYSYSSKLSFFDYLAIKGPYQLRAVLNWVDPSRYERDLEDNYDFLGDRAVEFFCFQWLASQANHDLYNGAMVCTDSGYNWLADETFFKPWITTGGEVVYQLERMRIYGKDNIIPENANDSTLEKIYLTNGLLGVALVTKHDYDIQHTEGSFVYIDNSDSIIIRGFLGASGDEDNTIEKLLDKVCKISGTHAAFPGDLIIPTGTGTINLWQ